MAVCISVATLAASAASSILEKAFARYVLFQDNLSTSRKPVYVLGHIHLTKATIVTTLHTTDLLTIRVAGWVGNASLFA